MSLVRLENVSKSFVGVPILDGVGFRVEQSEKIGLVGRNGTGKTTLFALILGDLDPDSGVVEHMRRARIGYLAQMARLDSTDTILHVATAPFAELVEQEKELQRLEHELADGDSDAMERYSVLQEEFQHKGGYDFHHRISRILRGLGFREEEFDLSVNALSGGQRTRLMLALVLLEDADLLLLDEPENHLDLEAREWLEGFLKETAQAVVVISHDRQLLDAVVDRIVEIERGELVTYTGNYDQYRKQKALRLEQHQKAFEKQQEFIEKEERWINRFRYKNTKASQVQSRIKRLEKMERIDAPPPDAQTARFSLGEVVRSGAVVLEAKELSMAYGDLQLYRDVSFEVERGQRIGIVGPNGSGKTTLLRHVAGKLEGGTGEVRVGHKVQLGFYDQHHESLNRANDIFSEIWETRPDMVPEQVRSFMGRFLFRGDDVFKSISALSGGEMGRVAIAKLILCGANVLLLDEPTNHLDIASREALESAVDTFPGSIVVVSHDRALIDRLVEKLIVVEDGHATMHLGNYARYRRKLAEESALPSEQQNNADVLKIRRVEKAAKRRAGDRAQQNEFRKRKKRFKELEGDIEAVEEQLSSLEAQCSEVDPVDYERAQKLKEEYDGLKQDLREMYGEWETLAEELAE